MKEKPENITGIFNICFGNLLDIIWKIAIIYIYISKKWIKIVKNAQ